MPVLFMDQICRSVYVVLMHKYGQLRYMYMLTICSDVVGIASDASIIIVVKEVDLTSGPCKPT